MLTPVTMIGDMAIPLMLINLGIQLRLLRVEDGVRAGATIAVRLLGGSAAAYLVVSAVGIVGVERQVLLLSGALPAAVINVVLAQRYDTSPTLVASAIVLGTIASLVTVPLMLWILL